MGKDKKTFGTYGRIDIRIFTLLSMTLFFILFAFNSCGYKDEQTKIDQSQIKQSQPQVWQEPMKSIDEPEIHAVVINNGKYNDIILTTVDTAFVGKSTYIFKDNPVAIIGDPEIISRPKKLVVHDDNEMLRFHIPNGSKQIILCTTQNKITFINKDGIARDLNFNDLTSPQTWNVTTEKGDFKFTKRF